MNIMFLLPSLLPPAPHNNDEPINLVGSYFWFWRKRLIIFQTVSAILEIQQNDGVSQRAFPRPKVWLLLQNSLWKF